MGKAQALEAAQAGAELLDSNGPDNWEERICLETLDSSWYESCILGQLYGSYSDGIYNLGLRANMPTIYGFNKGSDSSFTWEELDEAWDEVITLRQGGGYDETTTTNYIVMDGPYSIALLTTNDVEAYAFLAGLRHGKDVDDAKILELAVPNS